MTLLRDAPPPDHHGRDWAWDYDAQSLHINLAGLSLGSPLQMLVGLPWHAVGDPLRLSEVDIALSLPPVAETPVQ